jgi:hypothetical protein
MKTTVLRLLTVVAATALAACGGKSAPEPTEPAPAEPAPDPATATPVEPEPPAEPEPDPAQVKADLLAAEQSAFELARPIFEKHCARCHSKASKKAKKKTLAHFDMTSYPFTGHHADEITGEIREVLAIGGGKATMPYDKPGSVMGSELELIADWAEAYDKAQAGGAHEGEAAGAEGGAGEGQ